MVHPQGASRLELPALLLLAEPLLLTLQKLVALLALGERSHQLLALPPSDHVRMSGAFALGIAFHYSGDKVVDVHRVRTYQPLFFLYPFFADTVAFIAQG